MQSSRINAHLEALACVYFQPKIKHSVASVQANNMIVIKGYLLKPYQLKKALT